MTDFAENDPVEWEAGETVYCGAVREVLPETDRHDYLVQVYDRDAKDFKSATLRHWADDLFAAGELAADCACEMGDCTESTTDETETTDETDEAEDTSTDGADATDSSDDADGENVQGDVPADDAADETFYCAGNDGECSREVDEEGGVCWQHE